MAVNVATSRSVFGPSSIIASNVATEARRLDVLGRVWSALSERFDMVKRQVARVHDTFTDMAGVIVTLKNLGFRKIAGGDTTFTKPSFPFFLTKPVGIRPVTFPVFPQIVFVIVAAVLGLLIFPLTVVLVGPLSRFAAVLGGVVPIPLQASLVFTIAALLTTVFVGAIGFGGLGEPEVIQRLFDSTRVATLHADRVAHDR